MKQQARECVCVCLPTGTKRTCSMWKMARDGIKMRGQKLASRAKVWLAQSMPTPDLEYSLTRFSKKFVFALKADCFHPFKWVLSSEVTVTAKA